MVFMELDDFKLAANNSIDASSCMYLCLGCN